VQKNAHIAGQQLASDLDTKEAEVVFRWVLRLVGAQRILVFVLLEVRRSERWRLIYDDDRFGPLH